MPDGRAGPAGHVPASNKRMGRAPVDGGSHYPSLNTTSLRSLGPKPIRRTETDEKPEGPRPVRISGVPATCP